jgi:hypothetical protein
MSNAEQKLAQLFAVDVPPPASGRAFGFAVLERIERRRVRADVVDGVFLAMAACALLWVFAPTIDRFIQAGQSFIDASASSAAVILTLTALAYFGLERSRII